MIHWSGTLPAECQAKVSQTDSRPSKKAEPLRDRSQEQKQIAQRDRTPSTKPSPTPQPQISDESLPPQQTEKPNPIEEVIKTAKEHPELAAAAIAIGVGSTVAVVASSPLAIAVVVGAGVGFAIRTVL
ncbi:MAG: hypothetical protein F6K28_27435 [Microcoleus sp. SIO2G3]|nr:hypothetical protein [Microcoleus sp. SIO2G3]